MKPRNIPRRLIWLVRDHPTEAVRVGLGLAAILYGLAMINVNTIASPNYHTALWFFSAVQWCVLFSAQGVLTIYFTVAGYRGVLAPIFVAWVGALLWAILAAGRVHDGGGPDAVAALVLFSVWSAVRWQVGKP